LLSEFKLLQTNVDANILIKYIAEYRLLPNDALIAATCKLYNIDALATFDNDFRRVPWLRVIP